MFGVSKASADRCAECWLGWLHLASLVHGNCRQIVAVLGSKFKNWVPQRHRGYCKRTGAGVLTVLVASLSVALVIRELRCAHLVRSGAPLVCSDISTKILVPEALTGQGQNVSHPPRILLLLHTYDVLFLASSRLSILRHIGSPKDMYGQ